MRRDVILLGLLAVVLGVIAYVRLKPAAPQDVPRVFMSSVDDWQEFYARRRPSDTGWIHFPRHPTDEPFRATMDPFLLGSVKPDVCGECHADIYKSCQGTAHFRTTSEPTAESVTGSSLEKEVRIDTRDPRMWFTIANQNGQIWQTVHAKQASEDYTHGEPIGLVTGSGRRGRTYLFWKGDALYQLPLSYFSESKTWVNSPGAYVDGTADFGRAIGDRCLDCHATYFATRPNSFHRYDRSNYILGVTCVRCHGTGWDHVEYHRKNRDDTTPRHIVNPSKLSRDRANEVCSQCHSGAGLLRRPAFTYQPGKPLELFLDIPMQDTDTVNDDPHAANQLARLRRSQCYVKSPNLTCLTCHDAHTDEHGELSRYSKRCQTCHKPADCNLHGELGDKISDSCVQCHMPSKRDQTSAMQTPIGELLPNLRDHLIRVWPETSRPIADSLRSPANKKSPPPEEKKADR